LPPRRQSICEITHVGRYAIAISIAGELDMARENELLNLVVTLDLLPGTVLELDVSEVSFVDSAGLRSFVNVQAYLQGRRSELHLVRPQHHLLKLIELVGITDVFTVVDGQRLELVQDDESAVNG
jgi:anti-anti-sigma factor